MLQEHFFFLWIIHQRNSISERIMNKKNSVKYPEVEKKEKIKRFPYLIISTFHICLQHLILVINTGYQVLPPNN